MAKAIPNPEPPWNGGALERGSSPREKAPRVGGVPSGLEPWDTDELLGKDAAPASGLHDAGAADGLAGQLQAENNELRSIIAELQQELEAVSTKSEQGWVDRQKEYDGLIDEKNEMIRQMHVRVQELEVMRPNRRCPRKEELIAMSEELGASAASFNRIANKSIRRCGSSTKTPRS